MTSLKKIQQVESLEKNLAESPNFALVKFDKTTHQALEILRKELKKTNSSIHVVKNALFAKALQKLSGKNKELKQVAEHGAAVRDNSALLTLKGDYVAGLSSFSKFAKADKTLTFKFGFLDGTFYEEAKITALAQLPPKDQLIAKIIGSLKSSPSKLVYAMKYNITKLAYVLKERGKQS